MPVESPAEHGKRSIFTLPIISWAFYDFANTIFSFAVITRYFNEWIIDDKGRPDIHVGIMSFIVGLMLVVLMPALGAVSDQVGRRKPFLLAATAGCVTLTALLGTVHDATLALVIAGGAIMCFQLSLAMYDPLLAVVAPEGRSGSVSGLGVGLGYVGVLVGSQVLAIIVGEGSKQQAFLPTAVMFAVFALPLFLFVREPAPSASTPLSIHTIAGAVHQVAHTVREVRSNHASVARFLVARFFYVDAIATVIAFMTVYMDRVGTFTESQKTIVLGLSMVAAALGGFIAGRLVESRGPKVVLRSILLVAAATLVIAGGTGSAEIVWLLGPLVGITLGSVWASDRVFMLRLSPPQLRGEFFGVYNLVGKLSSGVGPLVLWGGTIWLLHEWLASMSELGASRVALVALAGATLLGWWILSPLSDAPRDFGQADVD